MSYFVNTVSIQRWAESYDARVMLPHLVRKLVLATLDRLHIHKVDFPAYESVQRPGFDGEVVCISGNAWVPQGHSVWELSVDGKSASKAGGDFDKRTNKTPAEDRAERVYVCLSARKWHSKKTWEEQQRKLGYWKDVKAFDADDLEQWMEVAPGVATWFALRNGDGPSDIDDIESRWDLIKESTIRPLTPQVFLVSREGSIQRLRDWRCCDASVLVVESRSPGEVIDFVCAAAQVMNEPEQTEFLSRAVIVESVSAWKAIRDNRFPSVLLVDPSVSVPAEEIGRAITRGHHVLLAAEPSSLVTTNTCLLERASEFHLTQTLETCGFPPVEAEQIARASGGSLAILKRKIGKIRARNAVTWDEIASQPAIVSSLLLGGWDNACQADREAVERLAGRAYKELERDFQILSTCRDPLLFHAAGNWRLLSKDEAWFVLGHRVTPSNLEEFCLLAVEILTDDDPKFELREEDRISVTSQDHVPRFSQTIKTHVAQTIAFLGSFGDKLAASMNIDIAAAMNRVVRDTLSPTSTWYRWASLASRLALLAEASPFSFLRAVRDDLDRAEPELLKLFYDNGHPFFDPCKHAGLLWALETLAWSKQFLPEVSHALLRLTEHDPGGQWANRPGESLSGILSHWMPYTTATVDERIEILDLLIADRPETAWRFLLKLLPEPVGGVAMPTHRPMWRDWANAWTRGTTYAESLRFATAVGKRVLGQAGTTADRWKCIFENLRRFPHTTHPKLIVGAQEIARAELSDADRRLLSDELAEQINLHRSYQDAAWSIPVETLDALESCIAQLKPTNLVLQHAWLFDRHPRRFFGGEPGSYREQEQAIENVRDQAMEEVVRSLGFEGVELMIVQAAASDIVGAVLARTTADRFFLETIPQQLSRGDKYLDFAGGFIWRRFRTDGWNWVDSVIKHCETDSDRAWFLVALPFERATWERAQALGDAVKTLYWQRCRAWNHDLSSDSLDQVVVSLVEYNRPGDAIDLLSMALHSKKEISTETLLRPLESMLMLEPGTASEQIRRVGAHDIGECIEALQGRNDVEANRLIRIEWNFLRLLDDQSGHEPATIQRHLCEKPEFFVEVLSLLYRSRDESQDETAADSTDEGRAAVALQCWNLLRDWKKIPGVQDNGTIDEFVLRQWCDEARRLADGCGRIEVCDSHLGQLFAHAPADPDGKWPCASVRSIIESIASDALGSGLCCGIMNSRGCGFRGKGGDQERELADFNRRRAESIRFYAPFTAEVLDSVARSYEKDARNWDERERWEQ